MQPLQLTILLASLSERALCFLEQVRGDDIDPTIDIQLGILSWKRSCRWITHVDLKKRSHCYYSSHIQNPGTIGMVKNDQPDLYPQSTGEDVWFRQPSRHRLEITANCIV